MSTEAKSNLYEVVCIGVSVYGSALTRGKTYIPMEVDQQKDQVKIKGDNGRTRWFPNCCFGPRGTPCPVVAEFEIDELDEDELRPNSFDAILDVNLTPSNGKRRWCIFTTPTALTKAIHCIPGTDIPYQYDNRHIIIANELSHDLIGRMLKEIDSQGMVEACTRPYDPE